MTLIFDTLAYTKALESGGVRRETAEVHAEAVRDHVMRELVTRADLEATKADLEAAIERLALRLTIRLGSMLLAGGAVLIAAISLMLP